MSFFARLDFDSTQGIRGRTYRGREKQERGICWLSGKKSGTVSAVMISKATRLDFLSAFGYQAVVEGVERMHTEQVVEDDMLRLLLLDFFFPC